MDLDPRTGAAAATEMAAAAKGSEAAATATVAKGWAAESAAAKDPCRAAAMGAGNFQRAHL